MKHVYYVIKTTFHARKNVFHKGKTVRHIMKSTHFFMKNMHHQAMKMHFMRKKLLLLRTTKNNRDRENEMPSQFGCHCFVIYRAVEKWRNLDFLLRSHFIVALNHPFIVALNHQVITSLSYMIILHHIFVKCNVAWRMWSVNRSTK